MKKQRTVRQIQKKLKANALTKQQKTKLKGGTIGIEDWLDC